jgi:hypothetical protein
MELFNEEIQATEFTRRVVKRPVYKQNLDDEDYVGYTGTTIRHKLIEYGESTPEFKFIRRKLLEACNFDVLDGVIRFQRSEATLAYLLSRKIEKQQEIVFNFIKEVANLYIPHWKDFLIPYTGERMYFKGDLV